MTDERLDRARAMLADWEDCRALRRAHAVGQGPRADWRWQPGITFPELNLADILVWENQMPEAGEKAEAKSRVVMALWLVFEQTITVAQLRLDDEDTRAALARPFVLEAALARAKAHLDSVTKAEDWPALLRSMSVAEIVPFFKDRAQYWWCADVGTPFVWGGGGVKRADGP